MPVGLKEYLSPEFFWPMNFPWDASPDGDALTHVVIAAGHVAGDACGDPPSFFYSLAFQFEIDAMFRGLIVFLLGVVRSHMAGPAGSRPPRLFYVESVSRMAGVALILDAVARPAPRLFHFFILGEAPSCVLVARKPIPAVFPRVELGETFAVAGPARFRQRHFEAGVRAVAFGTADAGPGMLAPSPVFDGFGRQFRVAGDTVLVPFRFLRHLRRLICPWVVVPGTRLRPCIAHDGNVSSRIFGEGHRDGLLRFGEKRAKGNKRNTYGDDGDDGRLLHSHFSLPRRIGLISLPVCERVRQGLPSGRFYRCNAC